MFTVKRFRFWVRRSVYRLSAIMAFFCCLEIFMHLTDGTRPNIRFPWGHYVESVAGMAVFFGLIAWVTKIGPYDFEPEKPKSGSG